MLLYQHVRRPKVHWFKAPNEAPCGARGTRLRFTINPSQITCTKCQAGAGKFFKPEAR